MIYQTWPLMGNSFVPDDIILNEFKHFADFENHSLVQFYHRSIAYFIVVYVSILAFKIYKDKLKKLYKPFKILFFILILQVILGVITLISGLNIYLASAHQITSVFLIFSAINLYYLKAK
tara:strand:- start:1284 stop:1643 length:360 start_codon:yes stop_codon:yes gene_type:complete